ncbi:MAG: hypothetical protein R3B68_08450 [Phycisphaerales bacterium]
MTDHASTPTGVEAVRTGPDDAAVPPAHAAPRSGDQTKPADPLAGVSFARASNRSTGIGGDEGTARFAVYSTVVVGVGAVLWLAGKVLTLLVGVWIVPLVTIIAALTLLIVALVAASRNTPRRWLRTPKWADPDARVQVLCPRDVLERLGPINDEDFEPEYVRILLVFPRGKLDGWMLAIGMIAGWLALAAVLNHYGLEVPGYFQFQVMFALGMLALAGLRQTYLRIAPGRLDVMRFTAWRPTADSCETFDLRSRPIVIDPRRRRVVVERDQRTTAISFLGVWNPRRVAHFLLRAAASTAPTPSLSREQLSE